jgi:hypothetical protein
MGFWIRNIIFGCILAALAYYFFANQDLLLSFGGDTKTSVKQPMEKLDTITTPQVKEKASEETQKEENKAAAGLSKFYANINADPNVKKRTIRNNIVYLPELQDDLELLLDARMKIVRPYPKNWQGLVESRPFRLSETIYEKLAEYAKEEKLEVFWRLNRDYVVKDAFRINKTILKTALQLGQGISGHFQNGVSIYFCYSSRSIVVIEGTKSYLDERCSLLKSNSGY